MTTRRATWCHVRRSESPHLHSLALRLQGQRMRDVLSEGQELLWDQIITELEWRSSRTRRGHKRCTCELCFVHPLLDSEEPF